MATKLPSRAEFLADGLVPVTDTTAFPAELECSICLESPEVPVKLPCNHTFCRDHITTYFNTVHTTNVAGAEYLKNECPFCRRKLFELDAYNELTADQDRLVLVNVAVRATGLLTLDQPQAPVEMFGFTIPGLSTKLPRAVASARQYLVYRAPPLGSALANLSIQYLGPRVIAMGHLLPQLAYFANEGLTQQQSADWIALLSCMPSVLSSRHGDETRAETLPSQLKAALRRQARKAKIDKAKTELFFDGEESEMLNTLLDYITQAAVEHRRERIAGQRRREQAEVRQAAEAAQVRAAARQQKTPFLSRVLKKDGGCFVM